MDHIRCKPSRRGRDTGPDVQPSGTMASPLQGPARWATIAAGMHATNAHAIDVRDERAANQREARRARRNRE